jgi:hypothetical protein
MELYDRLNQQSSGGAAQTLEFSQEMPAPYFSGVYDLSNRLEKAK